MTQDNWNIDTYADQQQVNDWHNKSIALVVEGEELTMHEKLEHIASTDLAFSMIKQIRTLETLKDYHWRREQNMLVHMQRQLVPLLKKLSTTFIEGVNTYFTKKKVTVKEDMELNVQSVSGEGQYLFEQCTDKNDCTQYVIDLLTKIQSSWNPYNFSYYIPNIGKRINEWLKLLLHTNYVKDTYNKAIRDEYFESFPEDQVWTKNTGEDWSATFTPVIKDMDNYDIKAINFIPMPMPNEGKVAFIEDLIKRCNEFNWIIVTKGCIPSCKVKKLVEKIKALTGPGSLPARSTAADVKSDHQLASKVIRLKNDLDLLQKEIDDEEAKNAWTTAEFAEANAAVEEALNILTKLGVEHPLRQILAEKADGKAKINVQNADDAEEWLHTLNRDDMVFSAATAKINFEDVVKLAKSPAPDTPTLNGTFAVYKLQDGSDSKEKYILLVVWDNITKTYTISKNNDKRVATIKIIMDRWEEKTDENKELFYVDHIKKTTTRTRPDNMQMEKTLTVGHAGNVTIKDAIKVLRTFNKSYLSPPLTHWVTNNDKLKLNETNHAVKQVEAAQEAKQKHINKKAEKAIVAVADADAHDAVRPAAAAPDVGEIVEGFGSELKLDIKGEEALGGMFIKFTISPEANSVDVFKDVVRKDKLQLKIDKASIESTQHNLHNLRKFIDNPGTGPKLSTVTAYKKQLEDIANNELSIWLQALNEVLPESTE
tara:strand:+ start:528 stop:2657 length:2130 start_codon:yes stop_codon:yes gene_type:complete